MAARQTTEQCFALLHAAGWSVGEAAFLGPQGEVWIVIGYNGENALRAAGRTPAEAWRAACEQARTLGMLGRGERYAGVG